MCELFVSVAGLKREKKQTICQSRKEKYRKKKSWKEREWRRKRGRGTWHDVTKNWNNSTIKAYVPSFFKKKKILGILTYTQGEKGKGFKEKLKRLHFHLLGRLNYKVIIIVSY